GRFVLWESTIPLLNEGNHNNHIYFVDVQNGILKSVANGGGSSNNYMSSNGELIAYHKADSSGIVQVYVQHRVGDAVSDVLVSTSVDAAVGNGNSRVTSISGDGKSVAFISKATNLISNDNT